MAMGMHVAAPLPRFRQGSCTPPPILSGGVFCISYRWHSADCAASIDHQTYTSTPFCKSLQGQPFDDNWKKNTENENGRYRRNSTTTRVTISTTTLSQPQQGGAHEKHWFNSDNEKNAVGNTWPSSQTSDDCQKVVGNYTNGQSFESYNRLSKANKERNFEISNSNLVLKSNKIVSRAEEGSYDIETTGNIVNGKLLAEQPVDQTDAGLITRCQSTEHSNTSGKLPTKSSVTGNSRRLKTKTQDRSNNITDGNRRLKTKSQDSRSLKTEETYDYELDGGVSVSDLPNLELEMMNVNGSTVSTVSTVQKNTNTSTLTSTLKSRKTELACMIEDVLVVDDVQTAKAVVSKLRGEYKDFVHACDTEVSDIDVKKESPVGHGKVICFSIYCGPTADFGNGKSCIWVDVLDTSTEVMAVFKTYFEDSSIKKVWHNFSFDRHVLANHGIIAVGFYADTMHLARLWNSGRKGAEGGYSLESLTSDINVMNGVHSWDAETLTKKTSMKDLFGAAKLKKDGTEGSIKVIPPVDDIQRSTDLREKWICYSSGDALCTWRLWESLQSKLRERKWYIEKEERGTMYDFYNKFWRPFGEILVQMEADGMLVDRDYLAEIEKVACKERATSISRFRKWAAKYSSNAQYINVTSDAQIRQLLFGGFNKVSKSRTFKIPNVDGYIEEGKKVPKKYREIEISGIGVQFPVEILTSSGLPAVSIQALKSLAGKVSVDYSETEEADEFIPVDADAVLTSAGIENTTNQTEEDLSVYGKAYHAFNGGQEGKEACKAIAALCEVSAIDTLISSFIQPLQGGDILGPDGRVHCSLNINTETGRLSARRPNLQNQPALEKDRYKIRQAFIASPGNSLIVADYGQLELRLLAHLANCKSMLEAFKIGGDFHSRTAMNMYDHVKKAVEMGDVILEWEPKSGENRPPAPLLKDVYGSERRKAKMLNFSIAYGKTAKGLSKDWKVSLEEAKKTVNLWYRDRHEVRSWQEQQKKDACDRQCVHTLLGRARHFPAVKSGNEFARGRIERAAINTPVQGSAADVAMLAMLEISRCPQLKELGWKLLLQVHDEMILEGPSESAARAKDLVVKAMSYPFQGKNILKVDLVVDAKFANSWYAAK